MMGEKGRAGTGKMTGRRKRRDHIRKVVSGTKFICMICMVILFLHADLRRLNSRYTII